MKILQKIQAALKKVFNKKVEETKPQVLGKIPDVSAILNRAAQPYHTKVVLPTKSIPTIHYFMNTNPGIAYKFVVKRVSNAIKNDWPMVELYIVGSAIAAVDRRDFELVLTKAEQYFFANNDVENVKRCRKLIARHKVNQVIQSTNKIK